LPLPQIAAAPSIYAASTPWCLLPCLLAAQRLKKRRNSYGLLKNKEEKRREARARERKKARKKRNGNEVKKK
jgi:hypothetical protein